MERQPSWRIAVNTAGRVPWSTLKNAWLNVFFSSKRSTAFTNLSWPSRMSLQNRARHLHSSTPFKLCRGRNGFPIDSESHQRFSHGSVISQPDMETRAVHTVVSTSKNSLDGTPRSRITSQMQCASRSMSCESVGMVCAPSDDPVIVRHDTFNFRHMHGSNTMDFVRTQMGGGGLLHVVEIQHPYGSC